jgi:AraC-like DNA-binding protein
MHIAEQLLAHTEVGVVTIAHRVGYHAEEAFGRAFKREHGIPPGAWRAAQSRR